MLKGVDVSKWQDVIDWPRMKNEVDFAIIRAGYGCPEPGESLSRYIDSKFYINRDGARNTGVLRGYYWFSYSKINSPEAEANAFCDTVLPLQDGELLVLDLEGELAANPVDWSLRFLNKVYERTGVRPLIYISKSINDSYDWSPVVNANYGLWLARWDYKPEITENTDWPFIAIKQYSNKGNVGGENPIDLNVFNGTVEQFRKYGYQAPVVNPPVVEPPAPPAADPHEAQIAELNATIAGLNQRISDMTVEKDQHLAQITELNRQIAEKDTSIEGYKNNIDGLNKQIKDLKAGNSELETCQSANTVLKDDLAAKDLEIAKLQKQSIIYLAGKAAEWISKNFKKLYNRN